MRRIASNALLCLLAGTLLSRLALAAPSVDALVAAERAFAAEAARTTVRDAFVAWLAPTATGFRGSQVVNIHDVYTKQKPGKARLAWEPAIAALASSGDLGWTTGPWTWRPDSASDVKDQGDYLTMWRYKDGAWRVAFDMGVSHPAPQGEPAALEARLLPGSGAPAGSPLNARHALWKADADFNADAAARGAALALEKAGAADIVALREGMPRVRGLAAVRESLGVRDAGVVRVSTAQFVSSAGDLGYTYGTHILRTAAVVDSSCYLHIWHRGAKGWELAVDAVQQGPRHTK